MFKLVVLSALLAVAVARPSLYESSPVLVSSPIVQEHSLANVGSIVHSVPTAVSHQSSSVVHSSANVVQPIVAPILKTYSSPFVHSYGGEVVAGPWSSYAASPLTYAASPTHLGASYPLTYASSGLW